MASGLSQRFSWAAKGCEVMSFFVFFLYDFSASLKILSKYSEGEVEGGVWDMVLVEGGCYSAEGFIIGREGHAIVLCARQIYARLLEDTTLLSATNESLHST